MPFSLLLSGLLDFVLEKIPEKYPLEENQESFLVQKVMVVDCTCSFWPDCFLNGFILC